jgi:glycerol-3-phosphate dehydrogenase
MVWHRTTPGRRDHARASRDRRLGINRGANPATLYVHCLGDLVLTCTDMSRNRSVGLRLGRGETRRHHQ